MRSKPSSMWDFLCLRVTSSVCLAVAAAWLCAGGALFADTNELSVSDKEIKFNFPSEPVGSVPLQLGSSLSTEYSADQYAGVLQLSSMTLQEGVKYPPLFSTLYAGTTLGETLFSGLREGTPVGTENRVSVTNWLNKEWAGVNLSLAHTYLVERPDGQLSLGASKVFPSWTRDLNFTVGEYMFNDLTDRYSSHATDLSVDYGWKRWAFSLFVEERHDTTTRSQWVGAQIKNTF